MHIQGSVQPVQPLCALLASHAAVRPCTQIPLTVYHGLTHVRQQHPAVQVCSAQHAVCGYTSYHPPLLGAAQAASL
jgi:hypothetical protein